MVAPVGSHGHVPARISKPSSDSEIQPALRGKSADSVGHRAKAIIASYDDAAINPANIRGKVASMIARGELDKMQNEPVETTTPDELNEPLTASTPDPAAPIVESEVEVAKSDLIAPEGEATEET